MKSPSRTLLLAFLAAGLLAQPALAAEKKSRLLFFDVFIDASLTQLLQYRQQFSRAVGTAMATSPDIDVLDQGTRDQLMLSRKFNLADCDKQECRFAMVKALPAIDYMLEAFVKEFAGACTVDMQVKSVKTGAIVAPVFVESSCEPRAIMDSLKDAVRQIQGRLSGDPVPTSGDVASTTVDSELLQNVKVKAENRGWRISGTLLSAALAGASVATGLISRATEDDFRTTEAIYFNLPSSASQDEFDSTRADADAVRKKVNLQRGIASGLGAAALGTGLALVFTW